MFKARLTVRADAPIAPINDRIYGSFIEHLGRAVYDGIHEPGHPTADANGFRVDVIELVKELGITTIRYPGGNFVSGYRWEDGVGPVASRPRRLDLAWHSTETNEVGLHEFQTWLDLVGAELMLAVNLGTRGIDAAVELLEYSNVTAGSALSERRAENGRTSPFDVKMWCLGNEMDGPWQLGNLTPDDYGKLAARTARGMRMIDPSLELVACGSSDSEMPLFGEWERIVLGHTYDDVDYISCHAYYENFGDLGEYLASGVNMSRFIESVAATADHVKAVRGSEKTINISFDEWNIWYRSRYHNVDRIEGVDNWPVAPRLLEDVYSVADAVVFGDLLITLIKHSDRVQSASLAQLVNVIAPIMTEPGGPAWRQTIFFPFAEMSRNARGTALSVAVDAPTYETEKYGAVHTLDSVATLGPDGSFAVYVVNRSVEAPTETTIVLPPGVDSVRYEVTARTLFDADHSAANTLADPQRIGLQELPIAWIDEGVVVRLEAVSWAQILFEKREDRSGRQR